MHMNAAQKKTNNSPSPRRTLREADVWFTLALKSIPQSRSALKFYVALALGAHSEGIIYIYLHNYYPYLLRAGSFNRISACH